MTGNFGTIMQHGYIVHDVEKTAREWADRVGVGPFYVMDQALDNYYYRGVRTPVELRLGFAYWGPVQIELIQPLSSTDTLYTRALKASAGLLNHCAAIVSDLDGLLEQRNLRSRIVQSGSMPSGVKFAYLEEYLHGGLHLELIEAPENNLQVFAGMEAIARQWDGRNPVRGTADLGQDLAALQRSR